VAEAVFKDQAVLTKSITARIFADIGKTAANSKGKRNKTLKGEFLDATDRLVEEIGIRVEKEFTEDTKKHYINSLDDLAAVFKNGIGFTDNIYGMAEFSPKYASRKRYADKHRKGRAMKTAKRFWVKERGSSKSQYPWLYKEYIRFSKSYKQSIRNTKGVMKVHASKKVSSGNIHRISIDISMPAPKVGGKYFDELLTQSFFKRTVHESHSRSMARDSMPLELRKIAWLETGPVGNAAEARPFISKMMVQRGQEYRTHMDNYMDILLDVAVAKGLVGFK